MSGLSVEHWIWKTITKFEIGCGEVDNDDNDNNDRETHTHTHRVKVFAPSKGNVVLDQRANLNRKTFK